MKSQYNIESGKLVIRDELLNSILWNGDFEGWSVYKILPLPDLGDCLVLMDPWGASRYTFENLMRVDANGKIKWHAQLPESHDTFSDMSIVEDYIKANTWNGFIVAIDIETGKIQETHFGK